MPSRACTTSAVRDGASSGSTTTASGVPAASSAPDFV